MRNDPYGDRISQYLEVDDGWVVVGVGGGGGGWGCGVGLVF